MHTAKFKKFLLSECCNCSCNFDNGESKITKLTLIDKHEDDDSEQEEYKEILNIEALSYIYGISNSTMISDISKHFPSLGNDCLSFSTDPLELDPINLAFCIHCATISKEIYTNLEKLYRSSNQTSFLAKATGEIRQLLGINELKIDVQDENCDIDESTDLPLDHLNDSDDVLESNELSLDDGSATINNAFIKSVSHGETIYSTNEKCGITDGQNSAVCEIATDFSNASQSLVRRRKQMLQTRDEQTFFITCPLCGCKSFNSTEFNQHSWDVHKVNAWENNGHQKLEKHNQDKESVSKLLSKTKMPDTTIFKTSTTILQCLNAFEISPFVSTRTQLAMPISPSCQICNIQFANNIDLQNHCLEVHQPDVKIEQLQSPQLHPVQCLICNSSFTTYEEFKSHQLQDCQCNVQRKENETSDFINNLSEFDEIKSGIDDNNTESEHCVEFQNSISSRRIFSTKRRGSAKIKTGKLKIKKKQLKKTKLEKAKLRGNIHYEFLHLNSKRLGGPPFNCPRCKQVCEDAITLKTHCRLTHKLIIRNFNIDIDTNETALIKCNCKRCNDSFTDTHGLAIHHKDVHSVKPIKYVKKKTWKQVRYDPENYLNAPFKCPKCEKVFQELDVLKQHHKFDHNCLFSAKNSKESYLKHKWRRMTKTLQDLGNPPYNCPECEKTFEDLSLLKTHAKSEHTLIIRVAWKDKFKWMFVSPKDFKSPPFSCPKCDKVFEEMAHLKTHCRVVHHYIVCASSKRTGETAMVRKNNIKTMSKSSLQKTTSEKRAITFTNYMPPFICPKCEKVFDNVLQIKSHCQIEHNENVRFSCFNLSCDECGKRCKSRDVLKDHCRSSHFDKFCVCDVNSSNSHSKAANENNTGLNNNFLCKQCELSYEHFENLRKHYLDFHSLPVSTYEDVTSPFVCLECNKPIETSQGFRIHNSRLHKHDTAYNCKNCPTGEAFSSIEKLTTHMEQVHKIKPLFNRKSKLEDCVNKQKNYSCLKCSKVFNSSQSLAIHSVLNNSDAGSVENDSLKEKPQNPLQDFCKCKFCIEHFPSVEALIEHTKSMHPTAQSELDSDYACKLCNKVVQNKKLHLETVHIRKQCPICHIFYGSTYLPTHMRKKHTGEIRSFKCGLCEREFATIWQQLTHEAAHSDVHPYVCASCGASFKYASSLSRHERVQHPSK